MPRPLIMGVVNVTPDSFSDGGRYAAADAAIAHGLGLVRDGADIVDVGGEATGPHSTPIEEAQELRRVMPVVAELAAAGVTVSIDTTKAEVARAAVAAGARIVNDVSGGRFDPRMSEVIGDATYICGHLRGATIAEVFSDEQRAVTWRDVARELAERLATLPPAAAARSWVDPGLGFGKGADPTTNLELVRHVGELTREVGRPVVVGPSRKRFLRSVLGVSAPSQAELDQATVAICLEAARAGAHVLRVHNVALLHTALTVYTKE